MDTPATLYRQSHRATTFAEVPINSCFENNGNLWIKKTTRTAVGLWPAILPRIAYFSQKEKCYA
ncbi:MAG: hypothetical protein D6698_01745 [Gammaproteobacteria bacterium]|nr:MAG: hypothetical protein D6698_01745 [Gammaproteobacteria bacterium]